MEVNSYEFDKYLGNIFNGWEYLISKDDNVFTNYCEYSSGVFIRLGN